MLIFEKALEDSKQLGLLEEALVAEVYLAKLSFLQGNFEQSIPKLESLYSQLQERNDVRGVVEFGLWLADWHSITGNISAFNQQLETIRSLVEDKGSIEQQFYYQTLSLRTEEQPKPDSELLAQLELSNIPEATQLRFLLDQARYSLKNEQDFSKLSQQIRNYNLSLHQYEYLYLLELEAAYALMQNDWVQLEERLNEADLVIRKMGNYWRSFQLNRLRAILADNTGQTSHIYRQRAQQQLNHLVKQLPEDIRQVFIEQQNIVAFDDDLMELGVNDE